MWIGETGERFRSSTKLHEEVGEVVKVDDSRFFGAVNTWQRVMARLMNMSGSRNG